MNMATDSNNDENRPAVRTARMFIAPTFQTVATTTPPGDSMSSVTVGVLQSAIETCSDITGLYGICTTNEMENVPAEARPACVGNNLSIIDPIV
jgi:hypothetical protein